ncbi:hypothetical protein D1816_14810 [Aquimarina sp. AD10]|uniref:Uncharacterized protein n=1 Tax=Aquimarina aggregata TaxID=1642818 RepID=A0A162WJK2_9FLAO|nr:MULTISPECIES: hypothetical protein [Aquimarina]AXT61566.1 hypothetical protein D1816_14810 [Aquimarina sp. AD10]KZS38139.1 hypothetical protein AWE51_19025 [Aquimarina aggregata]RKM90050.1 hypothetical protein D7033_25330 [Aquimarina sp. AD10]
MFSKILNLKDVQQLNKKQQETINGGIQFPIGCRTRRDCFIVTGEYDWACSRNPHTHSGTCVPL